jgi:tetratricopeptide (TPR) repeat protein
MSSFAAAIVIGMLLVVSSSAHQAKPPAKPSTSKPAASVDQVERERLLQDAGKQLADGRRVEAARLYKSAVDRFGSVQALLQLARIQSGDGNGAAALESLRQARTIAPNSEEVLVAFAQVSLATRNPMPAIPALQALARICPTVPEYHYQLGVAFMIAGDMPSAIEALERAQEIDSHNGLTLIALGLALNEQKRYEEAKPHLLRSLEITQNNIDALAALAESEEGLGDVTTADTHARRALAANAAHGVANLVMGLLHLRAGRYAEARDALLRAVAADPANPKAHYQLSLAYARLGDDANAKKHVDLYQQRLREAEGRLRALRGAAVQSAR